MELPKPWATTLAKTAGWLVVVSTGQRRDAIARCDRSLHCGGLDSATGASDENSLSGAESGRVTEHGEGPNRRRQRVWQLRLHRHYSVALGSSHRPKRSQTGQSLQPDLVGFR